MKLPVQKGEREREREPTGEEVNKFVGGKNKFYLFKSLIRWCCSKLARFDVL